MNQRMFLDGVFVVEGDKSVYITLRDRWGPKQRRFSVQGIYGVISSGKNRMRP